MIENLKHEIYPIIKDYINDCFFLFSDVFRVTPCDAARAQALLSSRQAHLSEQEIKFVSQLLDDISYLSQMEGLEEVQNKKQAHIVSISGLAIGRLVRLEQEMRTVCEVWGHEGTGSKVLRSSKEGTKQSSSGALLPFNRLSNSAISRLKRQSSNISLEPEDDSSEVVLQQETDVQQEIDVQQLQQLVKRLKEVVPIQDRVYKMEMFSKTMVGYEIVDWLIRELNVSRREANLVAVDLFTGKWDGSNFVVFYKID